MLEFFKTLKHRIHFRRFENRCWLSFNKLETFRKGDREIQEWASFFCICFEGYLGKRDMACWVEFAPHDDDSIWMHVAVPFLFSFHISFQDIAYTKWYQWFVKHLTPKGMGECDAAAWPRRIGADVCVDTFHLYLWNNPTYWERGQPWWWDISITPMDVIFGRQQYSTSEKTEHKAFTKNIPETWYELKIETYVATWRRPRWPWWPMTKHINRAEVTPSRPVPIPGKGENAWDMDEDATHGMTLMADTWEEAAQRFEESVMETRAKRASVKWVPKDWEGV